MLLLISFCKPQNGLRSCRMMIDDVNPNLAKLYPDKHTTHPTMADCAAAAAADAVMIQWQLQCTAAAVQLHCKNRLNSSAAALEPVTSAFYYYYYH
jgi:hypothetical protein